MQTISNIDLSKLESQLTPYLTSMTSGISRYIRSHIRFLKELIERYPFLYEESKAVLNNPHLLLTGKNWMQLEVGANKLNKEDDALYRSCLFNIARCIDSSVRRPCTVMVFQTHIDLLDWYRLSYRLGSEISYALSCWDKDSLLARSTTLANARSALKCLSLLCDSSSLVFENLCKYGLSWFDSMRFFKQVMKENPIKDKYRTLESALVGVLQAYDRESFKSVRVVINDKSMDITDLAEIEPSVVEQLKVLAKILKCNVESDYGESTRIQYFRSTISSLRIVFETYPDLLRGVGLDNFKLDGFKLLKKARKTLKRRQFNDLLRSLERYYGFEIYRHQFIDNLLPFHFERQRKLRLIDYGDVARECPEIMEKVVQVHHSEIELLPEKNYDMETLHTRFTILKRLLINYIIPNFKENLRVDGFHCLSINKNRIQKTIFQQVQGTVKSKKMGIRTGASYMEVIRWLMEITGQTVIEAFRLSYKRHQKHARKLRVEDLYSDDELRELVFYVEKGIREAETSRQLLALYFARIQLKSCWNTSPIANIELTDIAEVDLPTSRKSITLLLQKPRKGYDIDTYSLDGRSVNSVMRDILYVRDILTAEYRTLGDDEIQKYLFIYKERASIIRIDAKRIVAYVKDILARLVCSVGYNSMRIRKNGTNHLYREVAKQMRTYESIKLHTFDTFIQHYQRVNEVEIQKNLHTAVDVMQRYFTGREIDPEIKVLMIDDGSTQKTPTGECASNGNDAEAIRYNKDHRYLSGKDENAWCSDFLACVWCKHFRTVADPEHVWQLLSYRDYVLADMLASTSGIDNNDFQQEAIEALHERVNAILNQIAQKNATAVKRGQELMNENGMHSFWAFAVTSVQGIGGVL